MFKHLLKTLAVLLVLTQSSLAQEFSRVVVACPPGESLSQWKLVVQSRAEQVYGSAYVQQLSPHRLAVWLPNLPPSEGCSSPHFGASGLQIREPNGAESSLRIKRVSTEWDRTGRPIFMLEFEGEQKERLKQITTRHLNQVLEMRLGGGIKISPTVLEPISDGRVILAGPSIQADALRVLFGIDDSRLPPTIVESARRHSPTV